MEPSLPSLDLEAELSLLEQAGVSADALRALSERLEQLREEERTRISRELHDELGQLLTCIKLDFVATVRRLRELKTPGDVVDRLQSAVGQIDLGIAMVRRIATGLRPPGLDHRDLGGAIEYEARRMSAIAGVEMPVVARVTHSVDTEIATAAFRVFEEALTNAVRHAKATCISTTVRTTRRQRLLLCVSDNGIGIPRARVNQGRSLGLLGMSERARKLGGTLHVTSRPGHGTRVLLMLPLNRDSGSGIRPAPSGVEGDPESGIRDSVSETRDSGSSLPRAESRDSASGIRDSGFGLPRAESRGIRNSGP